MNATTEAVEAAARAAYEAYRAQFNTYGDGIISPAPEWEETGPMTRNRFATQVLPLVQAAFKTLPEPVNLDDIRDDIEKMTRVHRTWDKSGWNDYPMAKTAARVHDFFNATKGN